MAALHPSYCFFVNNITFDSAQKQGESGKKYQLQNRDERVIRAGLPYHHQSEVMINCVAEQAILLQRM